uniref:G-protein coupled receptors family 1 profile domain-containing protein n=1 Tax=Oreochromis niloticus TaxID=8128 RepID=A0A669CT38_ORENI
YEVSVTVNVIHPCYDFTYTFRNNPSAECILLYTFLGSLPVVTICGNLLVIISVVYFKRLHAPTNYLILSLPFSMAITVTSCWHYEDLFCKVRGCFDVTLSTASILNLCCISIDRYYAIYQPLTYKSRINDCVVSMIILLIWGIAVHDLPASWVQLLPATQRFMTIPVIIMLSIYLKIFLVALKQVKSIQNTTCQNTKFGATASKMEKKATKTLAIVMGVFLLFIEKLNWLTLSNSMLNPFIYAFFYSWFRSAFITIISGKIFQGDLFNSKLL